MRRFLMHTWIGIIGAAVLAACLQMIHSLTGNNAYILLYNVDYIPILQGLKQGGVVGILFHVVFCIVSVVCLYPLLKWIGLEDRISSYVLIYTTGSAVLYSLTALSAQPPVLTDLSAWVYWIIGHFIYSLVVGWLVIRYQKRTFKMTDPPKKRAL